MSSNSNFRNKYKNKRNNISHKNKNKRNNNFHNKNKTSKEKSVTDPRDLEYYCPNVPFTQLPDLRNTIQRLICYCNMLTSLPKLPNSLTFINCRTNNLVLLPKLPNSLEILYCSENDLISLPELPNTLVTLECWDNKLTLLPNFPKSLLYIDCWYNPLERLPFPTGNENPKLIVRNGQYKLVKFLGKTYNLLDWENWKKFYNLIKTGVTIANRIKSLQNIIKERYSRPDHPLTIKKNNELFKEFSLRSKF